MLILPGSRRNSTCLHHYPHIRVWPVTCTGSPLSARSYDHAARVTPRIVHAGCGPVIYDTRRSSQSTAVSCPDIWGVRRRREQPSVTSFVSALISDPAVHNGIGAPRATHHSGTDNISEIRISPPSSNAIIRDSGPQVCHLLVVLCDLTPPWSYCSRRWYLPAVEMWSDAVIGPVAVCALTS